MSTGMGSKWILAKFSNDFYGYGTEMDFKSALGLPVNQCGTKTEVLENCLRMQKVNLDFIVEMIDQITVYENRKIKISYNFGNELEHLFSSVYCKDL